MKRVSLTSQDWAVFFGGMSVGMALTSVAIAAAAQFTDVCAWLVR